MSSIRGQQAANWVMDRNSGTYILVTPANRQLYSNAIRFITVHDMPVPADTQQVIKILDEQHAKAIKQGEFTQADLESAGAGLTSRRFGHAQQARSHMEIDEPEPDRSAGHPDPLAGFEEVEQEVEPAPAPVKKAAKKKSAKKKAVKKTA